MSKSQPSVATVVLAGGQGTRLHPLTIHHSKPAVCYGGRYRLIDIPISNSINSNFNQIYVIAQYLASELQNYITETYPFDPLRSGTVQVLTPQENERGEKEWFKGTADAVRQNLSILLQSPADYFLILSGDQLYNIDFQQMVEFAQKTNADLTIASLPISSKEATRMGILKVDSKGKVLDFVEKPKDPSILQRFELPEKSTYLGSMGIYIFKREVLISLLQNDPRDDFGYHLITTAVQTLKTYSYVYRGYWEDIGTVASYYEANLLLTQSKGLNTHDEKNPIYSRTTFLPGPIIEQAKITQSILSEGSLIEAAEITHSIIGLRSRIGPGTIIRDSILIGNHTATPYHIGAHCLIQKAIIDENVQIGDHVKLTNEKNLARYDGDGIFIRDGIIIVISGTILPNHFSL
jgi:glucose-1-phosphate adenylyltransferase